MIKKLIFLIGMLLLISGNAFAGVTNLLIDDFEQNNTNWNTLGFWSGEASDESNMTWVGSDVGWAAHSGSGGAMFVCSNIYDPPDHHCCYFQIIETNAPYRDISDNYIFHKLSFWIRQHQNADYPGPMKIDKIKLEGASWDINGQVDFKNYNGGTNEVSTTWSHILIPISDFTNDTVGGFTLNSVKVISMHIADNVIGAFYIDEIIIVEGVEITTTDSSNITTGSNNENYSIDEGGTVRIKITERSNKSGCTGKITISPSSFSGVTNQNMIDAGNGVYYYDWDISSIQAGTYTVECQLNNTYATDYNGSNDSGADLTINLYGGNTLIISSIGTYNNNYPVDADNTYLEGTSVYIWIQEMNNITGATGYIDISPSSLSGITNKKMNEAGNGEYYYVWDTTGMSNGTYSLETRLMKAGKTNDMNGYNNLGVDLEITITDTLKISSIDSEVGTDNDEDYNIGDIVRIKITEKNFATGCDARITIFSDGIIKEDIQMTEGEPGMYYYDWDTTGLSPGTYYIETTITNPSHSLWKPDKDGYNDSGVDLIINLSEKPTPKDEKVVLWNNYPKYGEPVKIFLNSPDPDKYAGDEVSIKVYTLNGTFITEIKKCLYSQIERPELWYCDKNGEQLPNGVYVIYVEGAGIDNYKKVYLQR